ncbi:hypothetical protein BDZ97DRAFT_1921826 [Flammula alnicola]|nr:hypothetical protein BDZ97DRAFT_1921826 [Flammula alnicola]
MATTTPAPAPQADVPSAPASHPSNQDAIKQIQDAIAKAKRFCAVAIEDIVKPSINTFLETCDTNPRVAAIVATPALLAFLLVLAFLVLSTLVLVLWSVLTISIGVVFVILGGILSLFFKLLIVLLATIPLAGIATALLVGANAASQFIINKLPRGGVVSPGSLPRAVRETDWRVVADAVASLGRHTAQGMREATPILLTVRDALVTIGVALHSALHTAIFALNRNEAETTSQPAPRDGELRPAEEVRIPTEFETTAAHHGNKAEDEQAVVVEQIEVLTGRAETSAEGLKRRAPFPNVGDDEAEDKKLAA